MSATLLTVYFTSVASGVTLTTADVFASTTGGALTNRTNLIGTAINWGQIYSQGNTNPWAAALTIGNPDGNGWILDSSVLEGNQFIGGNWTVTVRHQLGVGTGSFNVDFHVRLWKFSPGPIYTQIGSDIVLANKTVNTSVTSYTSAATNMPSMNFAVGDKLYVDEWPFVNSNSVVGGTSTFKVFEANSASQGVATAQLITPGYQLTPSAAPYASHRRGHRDRRH